MECFFFLGHLFCVAAVVIGSVLVFDAYQSEKRAGELARLLESLAADGRWAGVAPSRQLDARPLDYGLLLRRRPGLLLAPTGESPNALPLRFDGSVASWGDMSGTSGQPTSGIFTQVSAGHDYCLALAEDGSIVHWGDDPWGYGVDEVPAGTDFVEISAGYLHGLALCSDGSLAAWGYNVFGQLGNNLPNDFTNTIIADSFGDAFQNLFCNLVQLLFRDGSRHD